MASLDFPAPPSQPMDRYFAGGLAAIPTNVFEGKHLFVDGDATTWAHLSRQADPAVASRLSDLLENDVVSGIEMISMNPLATSVRGLEGIISEFHGPQLRWVGRRPRLLTKAHPDFFRDIAHRRELELSEMLVIDNTYLFVRAAEQAGCATICPEPIRRSPIPTYLRPVQLFDDALWHRDRTLTLAA